MDEETTTGDAPVDTGGNGAAPEVDDSEQGSVTPEEIQQALGNKYKTVAPAKDEPVDEETETDDEETTTEVETEEEPTKPPVKPEAPAADADELTEKHAFTVEDANGVTFKITPGANIDELLKEFEPKNNAQIISLLRQLDKSEAAYEKDKTAEAEAEASKRLDEAAEQIQTGWKQEQKDLQAEKRIPVGKEGETRINEVNQFLYEQNNKRIAAGKPTIGSFADALDLLEAQEGREAKEQAKKDERERSKKNGALVGGSSAPSSSAPPVYRAGSAKNANQALRAQGIL